MARSRSTSSSRSRAPEDRLERYRAKRKLDETPEPAGGEVSHGRSYVIQKHHARRLHYDLRLEHDGVLLSWAVPKEPTLDTSVKRLAVHVEDHPIEYGDFEGRIPEGHYGAGTVEIWDRGTWRPRGDVEESLKKGELKFEIEGDRLKGGFVLVKLHDKEEDNWLLIKERDDADPIEPEPELEHDFPVPGFMLCKPTEAPPAGDDWQHEIKWDGYRIMAIVEGARVELRMRGGGAISIPPIEKALAALDFKDAILDGELVALDEAGRSDFGLLQETLKEKRLGAIVFVAFDLLRLGGDDLRQLPLSERQARLEGVLPSDNPRLKRSAPVDGDGPQVWQSACELGLEGIVSKRRNSPYVAARNGDWRKVRCGTDERLTVIGFTPYADDDKAVGSLLLARKDGKEWNHVGRVGTGFSELERTKLYERLAPLEVDEPPTKVEREDRKRARWVRPEVEVDVRFLTATRSGKVRQATFKGVVEEGPKTMAKHKKEPSPAKPIPGVRITNPDRVVDPESGSTKGEVAAYYEALGERLFQDIEGRLISSIRCPDGLASKCFFQRHPLTHRLEGIEAVWDSQSEDKEAYLSVVEPVGILSMVQFGTIEFHPWGSRIDDLERPNRLIFDLDPDEGVPFARVRDAARVVAERLRALKLTPYVRLSGGKGIHVMTPIRPELEWDPAKAFARTLAESLASEFPKEFLAEMSKAKRKNRIFIDYLRNDRTATAVGCWSLRAKPGLPLAVPIEWDELDQFDTARPFTIRDRDVLLQRGDPWLGHEKKQASLKKLLGL